MAARSTDHRRIERHRAGHRPSAGRGRLRDHALGPPPGQARGAPPRSCARTGSTWTPCPPTWPTRTTSSAWWPRTASASAGSTCWSTTPASGSAAAVADTETKKLDMQLGVNLRAVYLIARETHPDAQGGRRRARQGADGEHRLDRRQARPGLAGRLLGHQVRRGRPEPGAAQGARDRRHPGHRALPRLRGHGDDRLGRGQVPEGPDDPARGHRRGGALPAAHLAGVHRARRSSSSGRATDEARPALARAPRSALDSASGRARTRPGGGRAAARPSRGWSRSSRRAVALARVRPRRRAARALATPQLRQLLDRDAGLQHRPQRAQLAVAGRARPACRRRCSGPRRGRSWRGWCARRCGGRPASGRRRRGGRCRRRR